jgi:hypothetical protein
VRAAGLRRLTIADCLIGQVWYSILQRHSHEPRKCCARSQIQVYPRRYRVGLTHVEVIRLPTGLMDLPTQVS